MQDKFLNIPLHADWQEIHTGMEQFSNDDKHALVKSVWTLNTILDKHFHA